MKKALMILFSGFLLIAVCINISYKIDNVMVKTVGINNIQTKKTVIIDPGHGGIDVGTVGIDGSLEKNINLSISLDLYDFLMVSGINTVLTRDGDYEMYRAGVQRTKSDLYNRMDYINSVPNSILISIHQNHFENEKENGMQIWFSPNDDKSPILADSILNITKKLLQHDKSISFLSNSSK